jgi:HSP20 family molecular chaperone IbpA
MSNEKINIEETGGEARRVFTPHTDVVENKSEYRVSVDVPGVADDQIVLTVEKDVLTIEAHAAVAAMTDRRLAHAEYESADFRRVFRFPDGVKRDGIEASLKNGVLTVIVPKAEAAQTRRIVVKPSAN